MSKITQETFQEKFGDMLLHGLDSIGTYIPLRKNARYGINVAIRPMVIRVSSGVVLYGGKLRVGYTLDAKHNPIKTKITDISPEVRYTRLQEFCKGFSWQKADEKRFSTIIGFGLAATKFDRDAVMEHLENNNVAADFINRLETTYKQYNDVGFGNSKAAAGAALHEAWVLQSNSKSIFKDWVEFVPLPKEVVGQKTPLLNKAQSQYHDNVVSFQQKVSDWAEASKDELE
jgi:hypothetical protein